MKKTAAIPRSVIRDFLKSSPGILFKKFTLVLLGFSLTLGAYAQNRTHVTGIVQDENGNPAANVSVVVKGSKIGTTTDTKGAFSLDVPGAKSVLQISSLGYKVEEVVVGNRTNVNVNLSTSTNQLDEVVVTGYGTQKKATLTGAVSSVKGADVIKSPATNVSNSLAGRLPGLVTITPSSEPGYDGSILRIRGINTLNNNNPLVVVDGVPGRSLDRIDPSTIDNISVLKDASAAIYGAQAANGVIII
ncbi:MAG: TonB-dependent receptor plug domain-containing protein, partial [Ginsengibacter sp.]